MGDSTGAKACVICGQDCSDRPRVKDVNGRYSCKECFEKAKAGKATRPARAVKASPQVAADADAPDDAGVLSQLIDDAFKKQDPPCPACGVPMNAAQVICTTCGFNKASGKAARTQVVALPSQRSEAAGRIAGVAATVLIRANPLAWLGAALVGGAIGAVAWYLVAMQFGKEFKAIALAIGVLVGLCVKVTAGRYAGAISGGIAVAVSLAAIIGAKYLVFTNLVEQFERDVNIAEVFHLTEDDLVASMARDVARFKESTGADIAWPEGLDADRAEVQDDFPPEVWSEAEAKWKAAGAEWRARYKADQEAALKADYDAAKSEGFFEWAFLDEGVLFLIGAFVVALWVGSGGDIRGALASKEE